MAKNRSNRIGVWYKKRQAVSIDGFGALAFCFLFLLAVGMGGLRVLPKNMAGAIFTMVSLGGLLYYLGSHLPIVRTYFGGGSVFTTIGATLLAGMGYVPRQRFRPLRVF